MATVAIIEDSSLVVDMLTMVCEEAGHSVDSFQRFAEAVDELTAAPPDLIVTDLNLPDVSEGNAIEQLRDRPSLSDIPIIVVSGRPKQELLEIADQFGAQGALSKDDGMPAISSELPPMIDDVVA